MNKGRLISSTAEDLTDLAEEIRLEILPPLKRALENIFLGKTFTRYDAHNLRNKTITISEVLPPTHAHNYARPSMWSLRIAENNQFTTFPQLDASYGTESQPLINSIFDAHFIEGLNGRLNPTRLQELRDATYEPGEFMTQADRLALWALRDSTQEGVLVVLRGVDFEGEKIGVISGSGQKRIVGAAVARSRLENRPFAFQVARVGHEFEHDFRARPVIARPEDKRPLDEAIQDLIAQWKTLSTDQLDDQ